MRNPDLKDAVGCCLDFHLPTLSFCQHWCLELLRILRSVIGVAILLLAGAPRFSFEAIQYNPLLARVPFGNACAIIPDGTPPEKRIGRRWSAVIRDWACSPG